MTTPKDRAELVEFMARKIETEYMSVYRSGGVESRHAGLRGASMAMLGKFGCQTNT